VKAAATRRDPDFACGAVPVDHHARAVGELDLHDAALFAFDVGIDAAFFQRGVDASQRALGALDEFGLGHALPC
jgi:hypothetical protein